jgi:hypothetical protein
MFIAWQRAVGGRLKSDLRFSSTIVWNNLPLPAVDDTQRTKIAKAGRGALNSYPVDIARSSYSNNRYSGQIGVVRMYDRGLSAAEVRQKFEATRARYGI